MATHPVSMFIMHRVSALSVDVKVREEIDNVLEKLG